MADLNLEKTVATRSRKRWLRRRRRIEAVAAPKLNNEKTEQTQGSKNRQRAGKGSGQGDDELEEQRQRWTLMAEKRLDGEVVEIDRNLESLPRYGADDV
ncbi:hypothetical protein PIB30_063640 [Stylosanthes scabra]|uniref:Uncharacterized protein n=1 Tax=Stylosanthes scabra TaxID=79078 RepID=A0ABU6UNN8_9FABA|nr:hypothetical protein [Stylosanthes scabra]